MRTALQNMRMSEEKALQRSKEQIHRLLPKGNRTPQHYLFHVLADEEIVGNIWIYIDEKNERAFLYNIYIEEEERGKGYGTKGLDLVEQWLQEKKVKYFSLHVFEHNTGARKLYERLGFEVTSVNMMKEMV
jgi:RimJ/RimL family protein N-acetyltransferase